MWFSCGFISRCFILKQKKSIIHIEGWEIDSKAFFRDSKYRRIVKISLEKKNNTRSLSTSYKYKCLVVYSSLVLGE